MRYLIPIALILSTAAYAGEQPCGDAGKIHKMLSEEYGEKPLAELDDNFGRHLVIYVSPTSLSFTVVHLDKEKKITCGISAGTNFKPANLKEFFGDPS